MATYRYRHLLAAVDDVIARDSAPAMHALQAAPTGYAAYFAAYVDQLRQVKRIAEDWMERIIAVETGRVGDRAEAEKNVAIRRPGGAVVHPRVIDCIRTAWLTCQQLNDQVASPQHRVAPQAFVLAWLEQAAEHELSNFVATLPFWPMGQEDTGRWV